jgi:hypothetical protein
LSSTKRRITGAAVQDLPKASTPEIDHREPVDLVKSWDISSRIRTAFIDQAIEMVLTRGKLIRPPVLWQVPKPALFLQAFLGGCSARIHHNKEEMPKKPSPRL